MSPHTIFNTLCILYKNAETKGNPILISHDYFGNIVLDKSQNAAFLAFYIEVEYFDAASDTLVLCTAHVTTGQYVFLPTVPYAAVKLN